MRAQLRQALMVENSGHGQDAVWSTRRRLVGGRLGRTLVPPAKGRKHGAKAGRRKGGGRGGRH